MTTSTQTHARPAEPAPPASARLERRCACGQHASADPCLSCQGRNGPSDAAAASRPSPLPARAISRPDDPTEREADRMAGAILGSTGRVSTGDRSGVRSGASSISPVPPIVDQVVASPGAPLDDRTRAFFEPRLGVNLGHVRVHAGRRAETSARAVAAAAYTVGDDIVLGGAADRRLLAHELSHVVGPESRDVVWRYETPEHEDIGDRKLLELQGFLGTPEGADWAKKNKVDASTATSLRANVAVARTFVIGRKQTVRVSIGEVIALMGDFYATAEKLATAPDDELLELLGDDHLVTAGGVRDDLDRKAPAPPGTGRAPRVGAITRERSGAITGAQAAAEYQQITARHRPAGETFLDLGRKNLTHFDPANRGLWQAMHEAAIAKVQAPNASPDVLDEAMFIDAAAGHFLTDAFATGHLFDAPQVEVEIVRYLRANPPSPDNKELSAYYALVESQGAMDKLVLKNIHDRLNAEGFEVSNPAGMRWKSFGDDHLKHSADAGRIAALAVYTSRLQIIDARDHKGTKPSPRGVLDLLPDDASRERITAKAIAYIPDAARGVPELLFRQRTIAKEALKPVVGGIPILGPILPAVITSNLETISDPLRSKQIEEAQKRAQESGLGQPAPQFTIKRF